MKFTALQCPNCGAKIDVSSNVINEDKDILTFIAPWTLECANCDTEFITDAKFYRFPLGVHISNVSGSLNIGNIITGNVGGKPIEGDVIGGDYINGDKIE